jgi:hypothetical protein
MILSRIWPYVTIAALVLLVVAMGRSNGRVTAALRAAEEQIKTNRRMRDAVANTARDRSSVSDRLRDGDF